MLVRVFCNSVSTNVYQITDLFSVVKFPQNAEHSSFNYVYMHYSLFNSFCFKTTFQHNQHNYLNKLNVFNLVHLEPRNNFFTDFTFFCDATFVLLMKNNIT